MSKEFETGHTYDGIEVRNNPLPGWWKWIFIATIVFSPIYWMYYHGGASGRSVEDAYSEALAANLRQQFAEMGDLEPNAETILRNMKQTSRLRVGQSVFLTKCIECHGREGQGNIGPNLTDDFYKVVSNVEDIARVISEGSGGGAMPRWSNRLHGNEIVLVAAYVASLRGTDVDGRFPEGRVIPPWPDAPEAPESEAKAEPTETTPAE